jgi:hypothetical protein
MWPVTTAATVRLSWRDFQMRFVSMLIAAAALVCIGASSPAAVVKVNPDKLRIVDNGSWQVLCKVWFIDGTWTWGYLRWTGVQSQIDWGNAVVCCLQGTGVGFAPEPRWNLIGSRLELLWPATRSAP